MDKNTIIGFVLIAVVLIGFSWYSQPSAEQLEAQRKEDSNLLLCPQRRESAGSTEKWQGRTDHRHQGRHYLEGPHQGFRGQGQQDGRHAFRR